MSRGPRDKQTLWVVTECYYPEVVSQYLTQIAEGLTDRFDVKVICRQPNNWPRGTRAPTREERNGVEIFRVRGSLLDKNVVLYRVVNMLTLGVAMFRRSLREFRKGDRVLVVTAPTILPFTTAVASLIKGSSYTLVIHHYYPDHLIALGKLRPDSFAVRAMHFGNSWLFKHAARIIVGGRDMAELVAARSDGLDIPISIISNLADIEDLYPA